MRRSAFLFLLASTAFAQTKLSWPQLLERAREDPAGLREAVASSMNAKDVEAGRAYASHGPEFLFVTQAAAQPSLVVDGTPGAPLTQVPGAANLWYATTRIEPVGKLHAFSYLVEGKPFGGRLDLPVYGPLSYLAPGTPSGKLIGPIEHTSRIYDGMKAQYWIYVPAQYDPKTPAALMVFQDGGGYIKRDSDGQRILDAIDNLTAQKKIPVMIDVFLNPGSVKEAPGTSTYRFVDAYGKKWERTLDDSMRSTEYDTVSDRYPRYLRDEILAGIGKQYNLRADAYSRAITGSSSGAICAFNAAWQMPEQFSRVITWVGTFTSIQWKEDPANPNGGQDFPDMVLREPHRNIRAWLSDGANDQEHPKYGSWPLANIRMANALKLKAYDFHFSWSKGTHNGSHGSAEFPEAMIWLWRGYDPAKTSQEYEIEPAEKAKPLFRVGIVNREAE